MFKNIFKNTQKFNENCLFYAKHEIKVFPLEFYNFSKKKKNEPQTFPIYKPTEKKPFYFTQKGD